MRHGRRCHAAGRTGLRRAAAAHSRRLCRHHAGHAAAGWPEPGRDRPDRRQRAAGGGQYRRYLSARPAAGRHPVPSPAGVRTRRLPAALRVFLRYQAAPGTLPGSDAGGDRAPRYPAQRRALGRLAAAGAGGVPSRAAARGNAAAGRRRRCPGRAARAHRHAQAAPGPAPRAAAGLPRGGRSRLATLVPGTAQPSYGVRPRDPGIHRR